MFDTLLNSGIASCISKTISNPVEVIQITKQVNIKSVNILKECCDIYKKESLYGFFKGNTSNIMKNLISNGIVYCVFENMRINGFSNSFSSFIGSFISSTLTHPVDIIRTNIILQKNREHYRNFLEIVRNTSIKNLYNGYAVSCLGRSIYNTVCLSTFYYSPGVVSGFLSGALAISISYPTEVIRRRMYLQNSKIKHERYNNTVDCIIKIYKNEGVKGFYKGFGLTLLKVVISQGVYFLFYENLKSY